MLCTEAVEASLDRGSHICFGPFRLDPVRRELRRGDAVVSLRPKTAEVLLLLLEHAGQVVSKEEILAHVWGGKAISEYVLTTCISEIRQALGEEPRRPRFLETVHRTGYQLLVEVRPCQDAGRQEIRGWFGSPMVVGRARELQELRLAYDAVRAAQRQVVFLTGEMGIGKTTLSEEFLRRVRVARGAPEAIPPCDDLIARGQCIEQFGVGEPYMPLLEAFGRLAREPEGAVVIEALRERAPAWLVQIPGLIGAEERTELRRTYPAPSRESMLRQIADAVETIAAQRTLVLLLEDLHLSDSSTLEVVSTLARRRGAARLLVIGTARTTETHTASAPLQGLMSDLVLHRQAVEVSLSPLSTEAIESYLTERFAGLTLPAELAAAIHERTEGNPLFVSQLVDQLLDEDVLRIDSAAKELAFDAADIVRHVPRSLRAMVEHRVDMLTTEEREALEAASVAGVTFPSVCVADALGSGTEAFERICSKVADRIGYVVPLTDTAAARVVASAHYMFRHALYQQVLYERIESARRMRLHRSIGSALVTAAAGRAGDIAAELAFHFDRGAERDRAVEFYDKAAFASVDRGANREAVGYLDRGLAILAQCPDDTVHRQKRLDLLLTRGPAVLATFGYGADEVLDNYRRSLDLARRLGNVIPEVTSLLALSICELTRANIDVGESVAEELIRVAESAGMPPPIVAQLRNPLSQARLHQGRVAESLELADAAVAATEILALPQPPPESRPALWAEPRVLLHCQRASASFAMGLLTQAGDAIAQALAIARELRHPFNLTYALCFAALYEDTVCRWDAAITLAREAIEVGDRGEISFWAGVARIFGGHALARSGEPAAGIALLREGLERWRAAGGRLATTMHLNMLADAYLAAGDLVSARAAVDEAEAHAERAGERVFFPETMRLQAACLPPGTASDPLREALLRRAIDVSRGQGTRLWELRALLALHRQRPTPASHEALAGIVATFAAEPLVHDLAEARAELAAANPARRVVRLKKT